MNYKDALKYGFYEMQIARDWYREATADVSMQDELATFWIRTAALLVQPIAPHFAEHVWSGLLGEQKSAQLALWPEPESAVNVATLESGVYMRKTVKAIRDAETSLSRKKKGKDVAGAYNPRKPKKVRMFVAAKFPDWQNSVVEAVQAGYDAKEDKVDDGKVREELTKSGLIKDKRAMPFAQVFKVSSFLRTHLETDSDVALKKRITTMGANAAFKRTLPFSEVDVLKEMVPYLKRTLNLTDLDVVIAEEVGDKDGPGFTKHIVGIAEPGMPSYEFMNV